MQLGMIGPGRMGASMVRRLMKNGHECVACDSRSAAVCERLASRGEADFANPVLSAMRHPFDGHVERAREAAK
jgi:6-phosphogluconate dehydrogenase (decarboxylating)